MEVEWTLNLLSLRLLGGVAIVNPSLELVPHLGLPVRYSGTSLRTDGVVNDACVEMGGHDDSNPFVVNLLYHYVLELSIGSFPMALRFWRSKWLQDRPFSKHVLPE